MAVDGKALNYQQFVYLMLNKPEGVVSASTDKRDTTVVDLVGDAYPRRQLFPAGRLDKTSTGFVLLTDDGTFAHDILAPKRHVSKTYTVVLDTPLTEQMRTGFAAGVTLADGTALSPAEVTALSADGLTVRVVLRQGVYHQIKRMFGVYGAGVNSLHPVSYTHLYRRQGGQAHGVQHGPQARQRPRHRPEHRRHGHHCPQPLLHPGGGCGAVSYTHLAALCKMRGQKNWK